MKLIAKLIALVGVPSFLLALAGCSGKGSSVDPKQLAYLASAIVGHSEFEGKPAASVEDLKAAKSTKDLPEQIIAQVKSGDVVVVAWNVNFKKIGKEIDEYLIAYEKDAPTKGGYVVMGLTDAKKVTAEEFKTLKMANKAPQ